MFVYLSWMWMKYFNGHWKEHTSKENLCVCVWWDANGSKKGINTDFVYCFLKCYFNAFSTFISNARFFPQSCIQKPLGRHCSIRKVEINRYEPRNEMRKWVARHTVEHCTEWHFYSCYFGGMIHYIQTSFKLNYICLYKQLSGRQQCDSRNAIQNYII